MQLPELLSDMDLGPGERSAASGWDSSGDGDFASRSADSDLWPFLDDGGIGSAREGLELLEVLRRCAASVFKKKSRSATMHAREKEYCHDGCTRAGAGSRGALRTKTRTLRYWYGPLRLSGIF
jgi:hypothetical protein